MHLNSTVVAVRVDGDKKFVDYVFDGVQASCWVEAIVAGVGRAPTAQGLCLVYAYPRRPLLRQ